MSALFLINPFTIGVECLAPPRAHILRDRNVVMYAQACAVIALVDAVGRVLGVPLDKLWGEITDRMLSICTAGYYEEGKTLADLGGGMERIKGIGHAG